jgi:hypothetical protein
VGAGTPLPVGLGVVSVREPCACGNTTACGNRGHARKAAKGGHLEVLKWAREHDCPWNAGSVGQPPLLRTTTCSNGRSTTAALLNPHHECSMREVASHSLILISSALSMADGVRYCSPCSHVSTLGIDKREFKPGKSCIATLKCVWFLSFIALTFIEPQGASHGELNQPSCVCDSVSTRPHGFGGGGIHIINVRAGGTGRQPGREG